MSALAGVAAMANVSSSVLDAATVSASLVRRRRPLGLAALVDRDELALAMSVLRKVRRVPSLRGAGACEASCSEVRWRSWAGSRVPKIPTPLRAAFKSRAGQACGSPEFIGWQTLQFKRVPERCPGLADAAERVRGIAKMMTHLEGERLPSWIDAVDQAALPSLRRLARNLRHHLLAGVQGRALAETRESSKAGSRTSRRSSGRWRAARASSYFACPAGRREPPATVSHHSGGSTIGFTEILAELLELSVYQDVALSALNLFDAARSTPPHHHPTGQRDRRRPGATPAHRIHGDCGPGTVERPERTAPPPRPVSLTARPVVIRRNLPIRAR